jgi:N-methylhydantoinase B/oxoprolinase/acetone carboxylase alpha subunit
MDPITLEVISSSLTAYADEMTNSFWRSSYSYMNYEVRDFAVGFIDRDGRIIMQSRYTHPAFTGISATWSRTPSKRSAKARSSPATSSPPTTR